MIQDADVYRKARRVHSRLESKARDGTITPGERQRLQQIAEHLLVWEWAHDNSPAVEMLPDIMPPESTHPKVLRFLDWYERNRWREPFATCGWRAALWHWIGKPDEDIAPEIWDAAESVFAEEPGMVITDLATWNRMMGERRAA